MTNYVFSTKIGQIKIATRDKNSALRAVKRWDKKAIFEGEEIPPVSDVNFVQTNLSSPVKFPYRVHGKQYFFGEV